MPHPWRYLRLEGPLSTWSTHRCPCLLQRCWTRWNLRVPSNSNNSVILWKQDECKTQVNLRSTPKFKFITISLNWEGAALRNPGTAFTETLFLKEEQYDQVTMKGRGHGHMQDHEKYHRILSTVIDNVEGQGDLPSQGKVCWALLECEIAEIDMNCREE